MRRWLQLGSTFGCALLAWICFQDAHSCAYAQDRLELSGPDQPAPPLPSVIDSLSEIDAPNDLPEGAEVMVTGPLHEAFAEQFSSQPEAGIVISKRPPEAIEEVPPEYRPDGTDIVWIPGYWGWDPERDDFVWVTGIWRQAPPDRNWVPGYWAEVPEGFQWIAGFWAANTVSEIRYLPPPPEPLTADPSSTAPTEDHFWIPGQWTYVNNDYQWRAGYWTMGYPDWVWVPDRYVWTPLGCIYRPGYWDYIVAERGTVFCPVYYSQPVVVNYRLRPTYVVTTGPTLLANLFVYPRYHHYFFGNYYSSRYLGQSLYPWVTYAQQGRRYDPLYGYYRTQYRDSDYLTRLVRLHNYYAANVNYQPPRTLNAQLQHHHDWHDRQDLAFQALQLNKMVNAPNNVHHHMQLVKLADNERQQIERGIDPARQLRLQRAEMEARTRTGLAANDLARRLDRSNNDRAGDNQVDLQNLRWNLPQLEAGARLGSIAINNNRSTTRDQRSQDRDRDRTESRSDLNERNAANRNGQTPNGKKPDGVNDNISGKDNIPNRNGSSRDGLGINMPNRDPINRDPVNRDSNRRDNNNPLARDPNDKSPVTRDPLNRDPLNRDPLNRDPLNRDPRNPNGRDSNPANSPNTNPNRNPNTVPNVNPNTTPNRNPNANPNANPNPNAKPNGSDSNRLRNPLDARIFPGPGLQGGDANNQGRSQVDPRNRSSSSIDRLKDALKDTHSRTTPGRSSNLPGLQPGSQPGSVPGLQPGTQPSNQPSMDRLRIPRANPAQPRIAPGEPNPSAPNPNASGARGRTPSMPGDIQNDLKSMREMSQRQLQRRQESNNVPRRAPQPPNKP